MRIDRVHALRHLADDRVVGRQAGVCAGDDEELAAGRARRLDSGLRHRDDALCVLAIGWRHVDRRVARARRRPTASGRRPGSRSRARRGGRSCRRSSPSFASATREAAVFGASSVIERDGERAATRVEGERVRRRRVERRRRRLAGSGSRGFGSLDARALVGARRDGLGRVAVVCRRRRSRRGTRARRLPRARRARRAILPTDAERHALRVGRG